jgi:AraC-like DNA-binding protein
MVRLGVIRGFERIVAEQGGDPERVLEVTGLRSAAAGASDSFITLDAYSSFLETASSEARLPTFSIDFGQAFDVRNLGAIGYLFGFAPDLGTAMKDFCENFEVVQDNTDIRLEHDCDLAKIVYWVRSGAAQEKQQDAEFSVAMLAAVFNGDVARADLVRHVEFEHKPQWDRASVSRTFGNDIRSDAARNAVYLSRHELDRPGYAVDPLLYELVLSQVRSECRERLAHRRFVGAVTEILASRFRGGRPKLTDATRVSAELGISERTLHRRLSTHGTNFRDLRNSVLLDQSRVLLKDTRHSVTEIALQLGFSETSAFSRAFRLLSGKTPAEFRNPDRHRGHRH